MKRLIPSLLAILAVAAFAQPADAPGNRAQEYAERLDAMAYVAESMMRAIPSDAGYFEGRRDSYRDAAIAIRAWESGFPEVPLD